MQTKRKIDFNQIFSIVVSALLLLAHVAIILVSVKSFRFYSIYPELFNYIFGIIICIFIIIDIVFFIGVRRKDIIQKGIICVMAILLSIGGLYGTVVMNKTNEVVDNVIGVEGEDRYETVSGLFVTYNKEYSSFTKLDDLNKIENLKVGTLIETSEDSISSIGLTKLTEANIKYENKGYTNNTDLLFALIGGEIDVAVFPNVYKAIFRADDNVDYTQYLDQMNELEEFSKDIIVKQNTSSKDLSKDPFNVLLIGWSPIIGSDTIGLADAIIVCTVNPQTYTVSMMSIARDSYVPIPCYGGTSDKINSGRSTSMDCFVSTVEQLIGEQIDFYMEIGFAGFAILVDCVGGVEINNPVSFELDGVYVPEGNYVAEGWQALQFARERHHMPNGDFDRQQHQKEVIMQIAKKFLKHDLAFALDVFNEVSQFINTNLTLSQLSGVFNMLKATKNYTGVSLFNMLDMQALRITGYADWHYNDDYELPLWIYRLYQGSLDESLEHMHNVMGEYKTMDQSKGFNFDVRTPYVREPFYSTVYNEEEVHEKLPPYYGNLTSMTYADAMAWAKANGATLVAEFIGPNDSGYDESRDGMVISQSIAYGKKVSKYPVCNIVVMGNGKRKVTIPDFASWGADGYERAKVWCADNGLEYVSVAKFISSINTDGFVSGQVYEMLYDENIDKITIKYYKTCGDNATPSADGSSCSCASGYAADETGACKLQKKYIKVIDGVESEPVYGFTKPEWTAPSGYSGTWVDDDVNGVYKFVCTVCQHAWVDKETVAATCTEGGYTLQECTKCHSTKKINETAALGHSLGDWVVETEATCDTPGSKYRECSVCHEKIYETIEAGHNADGTELSGCTVPPEEPEPGPTDPPEES